MNDQVLDEMRVEVERAVRPVRAGDAQKLRMREDLLDHLTAIYDEELERLGDEAAALARAKERFGDPRELTDELQRSLSWLESMGFAFDQYRYRPGDSLWWFGLRHLLLALAAMTAMVLLMLPVIWMRGRIGEIGIFFRIASVTTLFSACFSFSIALLGEQMGQVLYGRGCKRPAQTLIRCGLLSLLVFPFSATLVYGGLMLSLGSALKGLMLGCVVAPAAPLLFYMQARQMKEQISGESEWAGIKIDQ